MRKKAKQKLDEIECCEAECIDGVKTKYVGQSMKNDFYSLVAEGKMLVYVDYVRILTITPTSSLYPFNNVADQARCFYALQDCGFITVGGQRMKMEKGAALIIFTGAEYTVELPEEQVTYIAVNFDYMSMSQALPGTKDDCKPMFYNRLANESKKTKNSSFLYIENARNTEKKLKLLVSEYQKRFLGCEMAINGVMAEIIVTLLRLSEEPHRIKDGIEGDVLQYIDEHYAETLTNKSLAMHFGFHPNYLNSLIKQATGTSLHQYLIRIRLLHAAEMLESGQYLVNEVSELVGFQDSGHFSRLFKVAMGATPSEYVKNIFKGINDGGREETDLKGQN